ncbi:hypothetical protein [Afifella sp. YEN Y35]|uniref:hypothetical protein n=1 Tax=Afifella sp. YEN Y35 TaxID=3388337 RepID=UPI0039E1C741
MGLLDLPAPLFGWIDGQLSHILPSFLVVLIWASVASIASMELYRLLSPQARIAELRVALKGAQERLSEFDGPFDEAGGLIRNMLGLALKRVFLVLPSTLIASLPLLTLILWLDSSYARTLPPEGQSVTVRASGNFGGEWVEDRPAPRAIVKDASGATIADVPVKAPVPVVHKKQWWNYIIGNPIGYLADEAPVDEIEIDLPKREIVTAGPSWARGWEIIFFPALILMSFAAKSIRRIE